MTAALALNAIGAGEAHPARDGRGGGRIARAVERIGEQRGDDRVALEQQHLKTGSRQKEGVLAQPRRRVHRKERGVLGALASGGAHQQLALQRTGADARQHILKIGHELHAAADKGQAARRLPELKPLR